MKIVRIIGGLGNQMFQYALYVALKKKFQDETVKIDTSCFRGYPWHNGYELDRIFNLDTPNASIGEIIKVGWPYLHYRVWQLLHRAMSLRGTICMDVDGWPFNDSIMSKKGPRYFDGYWQNERYFRDAREEILNAFKFPEFADDQNRSLAVWISNKQTASIHIRRGDYLKNELLKDICSLEYYKKAVDRLTSLSHVEQWLIFSDDPSWVRTNFDFLEEKGDVIHVDWNHGNESFRDMQLMSLCHHNVIANSSFSWWGAWLNQNPDKIVIAPAKWMNTHLFDDPVPNDWVRIGGNEKFEQ